MKKWETISGVPKRVWGMKIMLGAILREETHTKIVDDSTNDDNNEIVARVMRHTYIVCVLVCMKECLGVFVRHIPLFARVSMQIH